MGQNFSAVVEVVEVVEWRVTLVRTASMPSPDAAARHTGAGVARRQAHHERMRDERAREAAAGDAELPPEDDAVEMASAVHVLDSVAVWTGLGWPDRAECSWSWPSEVS